MNVAFGFNAHSGWAALVIVGRRGREYVLSGRRRVELVDQKDAALAALAALEGTAS